MSGSPFFTRIRGHVLQLTAAVPEGRVCTYQSMGEYLDVVPRHLAYILSQLSDDEKLFYPWHRVVGSDGNLGTSKRNPDGTSQAELLRAEGIDVRGNRISSDLKQIFLPADQLPSNLPRQKRPSDAPAPTQRRKLR